MYDCSKNVLAFHDEKVTLLQAQRTEMRDRRNSNRQRLKKRLKEQQKPTPEEFIKQGSYAMLTMVQDLDNDYDIDDGVYFAEKTLKDKDGNALSPLQVREMVRDALRDERFKKQPKVLRNCVRIFYKEGYHVDMPIYRIRESDGQYELASGDQWIVSRAADVEEWFDRVNQSRSPDEENGRQFRRISRDMKKFARSRVAWKGQIANGFTITKLVEECYVADGEREDVALRKTMQGMHDRLVQSLEVLHPVTPGAMLTSGPDDSSTEFLRDQLAVVLEHLEILDDRECTEEQALSAWDKVFNTKFFSARTTKEAARNVAILSGLMAKRSEPRPVDKRGGGRFA